MTKNEEVPAAASDRLRSNALARAIARLNRSRDQKPQMSVGEISDRLSQLGPLYLLMAVACIAVSPLSGIPFVTAICGVSIAALSLQVLLGHRVAWLPTHLRRRTVQIKRLNAGLVRADGVAGRLEHVFSRRWVWLTRGPVRVLLLCICIALGLLMPFLEIIPFAGTTLASAVLVIAIALIARDGLAALIAAVLVSAAVGTAGIVIVGS